MNSKSLPWGRNSNPILLKDDVGCSRPTTFELPGPAHAYGKKSGKDGQGVQFLRAYKQGGDEQVPIKLVTNNWQQQQKVVERKVQQNFVQLNKLQANSKAVTAKDTTEFRRYNTSVKASLAGSPLYNIVLPSDDFRYGVENRPSTPIKLVVGNCYGIMAESEQEQAYRIVNAQKRTQRRKIDQKITKAQVLRATRVGERLAYVNRQVQPEQFKLHRFNSAQTLPRVWTNLR